MVRRSGRLTVREARVRRRAMVLSSEAYREWWAVRQDTNPRPTDPYRAFMIDGSLRARQASKDKWGMLPNRLDHGFIDSHGSEEFPIFAPAPKTREVQGRKHPEIKRDVRKPSPIQKEVLQMYGQASQNYGIDMPDVNFNRHEVDSPLANAGMSPAWDPTRKRIKHARIELPTKGSRGAVVAIAAHELGHYIHGGANPEVLAKQGVTHVYRPKSERMGGAEETFKVEQAATKIGKSLPVFRRMPKLEQARGAWQLRYALETYRKTASARSDPNDPLGTLHIQFGSKRF